MNKHTHHKHNALGLLLAAGMVSIPVQAAPQLPDAGQTSRELQQEREIKKPKAAVPVTTEDAATPSAVKDNTTPIPVTAIHVTGSTIFSASVLEALVADMAGTTTTLAGLEAGIARITNYYREHGYFLTNAYLPAQEIKDGVLQIAVQEGTLSEIKLDNTSRVKDSRVQDHLTDLNNGSPLEQAPLDRQLLLLRDTAGIGGVRAILQPGTRVGTSDLLVETTASAPYNARVQVDNYGNYYTGEYRIGASLAINSPLKIGDQLTLRAVGSDRDMAYGRLAYQLPVGADGLRIGAAYAHTQYQLDREYRIWDAHGTARSSSVFATYPFVMSQTGSLIGSTTYEHRLLKDDIDSVSSKSDKTVNAISIGLMGNHQDDLNEAGQSSFDVLVTSGDLSMDAISRENDAKLQSNGHFTKANYMVNRLQRITNNDTLSATLSGQWAADNLNSSDKFSLGGPYSIRAFPQGEANGDEGNMLNLELRHRILPQLQGVLFYDYGSIKVNHDNYGAADNRRTIAGAGVGVNAQLFNRLQLDAHLAWRTQGGTPVSEPASAERTPRLWVQLSGEF